MKRVFGYEIQPLLTRLAILAGRQEVEQGRRLVDGSPSLTVTLHKPAIAVICDHAVKARPTGTGWRPGHVCTRARDARHPEGRSIWLLHVACTTD